MKRNDDFTPLNIIERLDSRISLIASFATLAILIGLFAFLDYRLIEAPRLEEQVALETQDAAGDVFSPEGQGGLTATRAPITPGPKQVYTASVVAVGDNLYHSSVYQGGVQADGTWNYDRIYDEVRDIISAADLAIVDQETVLTNDHSQVSSYPLFATPTEAGDALVNAGFDVVYSATNHTDDMGLEFLQQTLEYWRTKHPEITLLGIHETPEDAEEVKIREVNGIRIAFLNFTYGTNTMYVAGDDEYGYMIDLFSEGTERVAAMIEKARAQADCVVFVAHWGTEDESMPDEYEKQWSNFLLKHGVDVVIGGHPHVLQPYGRLKDDEGNEMVIFYSLGNFISAQNVLAELVGGMASFTIQKTVENGEVSIEILDPLIRPTVTHYDEGYVNHKVYMLEDYTEYLASQHGAQYNNDYLISVENFYRKCRETFSMNVEPSAGTYLLNVTFRWDGVLLDPDGSEVVDVDSINHYEYYGARLINISDYSVPDDDIDYTGPAYW